MIHNVLLPAFLCWSCLLAGQPLITVAESTFKISGIGEKIFYYGFCEGDQLILNFKEINGRELKEVEILEYPNASKFMDYKTANIDNRTINITTTGIYQFRFKNTAIRKRVGWYKLERIPATNTLIDFNTSVYTKTVYDTTFTTSKEKYLVSEQVKPVTIIQADQFYINSGARASIGQGKSRITIPINLPRNTIEWYYSFSAYKNKKSNDGVKASLNLASQLSYLIDQSGMLGIGIGMLTKPTGESYCDLYLLDYNNSRLFEDKQSFSSKVNGSKKNYISGNVKIAGGSLTPLYLGLKNPASLYGINVAVEVVALTLTQKWGEREVQKAKINAKKVFYLKN